MTYILYQDETGVEMVMANISRPARELVKDINTRLISFQFARACLPYRQYALIRGGEVLVAVGAPPVELTARHYDVLFGLVDGLKTDQIARRLGLSRRTVYMFIAELKERFAVPGRIQIVLHAVQLGLVEPLMGGR